MALTMAQQKARQHRLNMFTSQYLKGVGSLAEDGREGPMTSKRIKEAKWWLGYVNGDDKWSDQLDHSLQHPYDRKNTSGATVFRGARRRAAHNLRWVQTHLPVIKDGISTYDGVRVASVTVPVLNWCRANGWNGHVVSGYRDPQYSQSLCYARCGRPRCPGTCAGLSSNHVGKTMTRFAVDVSDYVTFRNVVARCPLRPKMYNRLPSDPVHFSANGQ